MNIILTRNLFNDVCTFGELNIAEADFSCFVIEDVDRKLIQTDTIEHIKEVKVFGKTCIPYGTYEIAVTFSNKFKKFLPLLMNVPGFEGIRIHSGNTSNDSDGCLLPGLIKDALFNQVLHSRAAFAILFNLINEKIKTEKVFIEIKK